MGFQSSINHAMQTVSITSSVAEARKQVEQGKIERQAKAEKAEKERQMAMKAKAEKEQRMFNIREQRTRLLEQRVKAQNAKDKAKAKLDRAKAKEVAQRMEIRANKENEKQAKAGGKE